MHYGHVGKLAHEILDQAKNLVKGSTENSVSIPVKAGQVIAYIGNHPGFDIGFFDLKKDNYFCNPDRYTPDYRSTVPFTDYLVSNLREQIWKINPRTIEPLGGKVNYDVDGTISGNWFLEGTNDPNNFSNQLIIAYHERWADRIIISDASPLANGPNTPDEQTNLWWIIGNTPAPEDVTKSSRKIKYNVAAVHKFVTTDNPPSEGTVMIEMIDSDKLKFEYFEGVLPDDIEDFSQNVKIYER